jgi:hypothetical protein
MDCSLPSSVVSFCHGNRGGKLMEKDYSVKIPRARSAAVDAAVAVGLKLRKQNFTMKDKHKAGLEWAVKSGFAKPGSILAATLANIVAKVYVNKETENPVWN